MLIGLAWSVNDVNAKMLFLGSEDEGWIQLAFTQVSR